MNDERQEKGGGRRRSRWLLPVFLLVGLLISAVVYAGVVRRDRGQAPKLLNLPTEARQVRPFTEKPDKRFAPLPIEREKHEK
jgi:hypothetical protein